MLDGERGILEVFETMTDEQTRRELYQQLLDRTVALVRQSEPDGTRTFAQEEIEDFCVLIVLDTLLLQPDAQLTSEINEVLARFCARSGISAADQGGRALQAARQYLRNQPPPATLARAFESIARELAISGQTDLRRRSAALSIAQEVLSRPHGGVQRPRTLGVSLRK
ncbi:MAG: hypothetical protein AAB426_09210 [Myxococcota bacterium]